MRGFRYRIDMFGSIDYKDPIGFSINRYGFYSGGTRQYSINSGLKTGILIAFGIKTSKVSAALIIQHIYPSDTVPCNYRNNMIGANSHIVQQFFTACQLERYFCIPARVL